MCLRPIRKKLSLHALECNNKEKKTHLDYNNVYHTLQCLYLVRRPLTSQFVRWRDEHLPVINFVIRLLYYLSHYNSPWHVFKNLEEGGRIVAKVICYLKRNLHVWLRKFENVSHFRYLDGCPFVVVEISIFGHSCTLSSLISSLIPILTIILYINVQILLSVAPYALLSQFL